MFTGIVEERGHLFWRIAVANVGEDGSETVESHHIVIECPTVAADAQIGDSIAVDGVCLTVTGGENGALGFDLSDETIERTTFGRDRSRGTVNLERPVTLMTRLGGHLVQGHVDGVGTVDTVKPEGDGARMTIRVPDGLDRYLVEKGSVAVDGVSLTVASLGEGTFDVSLIPHTLAVTTLGERRAGDDVNLEVDMLAKYVERLMRRTG
ncbi:MAG TPA: riboflavin synthase [Actinomycetota bacterium]